MSQTGDAFFGELRSYFAHDGQLKSFDLWLTLKLQQGKLPNIDEYLLRHVPYIKTHPQFVWPNLNLLQAGVYKPYHLPFATKVCTRYHLQWAAAAKSPFFKQLLASVTEARHQSKSGKEGASLLNTLDQEILWELGSHTLRQMVVDLGKFSVKHLVFNDATLVYHPYYENLGWETLERVTINPNYPIRHNLLREWSYLKIPHIINTLHIECHSIGHAFDVLHNLREMTLQAETFFTTLSLAVGTSRANRYYRYTQSFDASNYYDEAFVWVNSLG